MANIYYCQPLLNMIRQDMAVSEFYVNLMPVLTQVGYALGLLFIVPLDDMINRRRIVLVNFSLLIFGLMAIYAAPNVHLLLAGSFVTGVCSVTPQIFMPMVSLFSKPEEKELKTGMVLSGLLTGVSLALASFMTTLITKNRKSSKKIRHIIFAGGVCVL